MILTLIMEKMGLKPVNVNIKTDIEVNHVIVSDILSDVMAKSQKGDLWITNQTHVNVIAIIYFKGLSGVILPGGRQLEDEAFEKAIEKKIPVFVSTETAFDLAGRLYALGLKK